MAVDHNNPQSRDEEILIATIDGKEYNKNPQSRMEELLLELKETIEEGGGGGGTTNYNNLSNQPQVNGETLIGDKTGAELGLVDAEEGKGLSTNDYDDTEKAAVAAATSDITAMKDGVDIDSFGDVETALSAIKDGSELDSFGDVEVALLDKADTSDLGTAAAKDSTNAVTAGSTDLVESGAVKDAIDAAVAAAYHHAGTKTVAQLTHDLLITANEGNVYNITDSGTTTSDFIEGIGKQIDAGDNVGICKVGNTYMFDLLSGFVDTTNFVQKSQTAGLLKNDGTVNTTIEGTVADHTAAIATKQPITDNTLQTTDKTIPGAINELKSGFTNLDTEVNGDATTYPYADVITIDDAVPSNLADCNVKIEPVQDLHGYDKPWVGGAGKNLVPLVLDDIKTWNTDGTWNGNTYTHRDTTFEILTDSNNNVTGISVSGTPSGTVVFDLGGITKGLNNSMILNGCPSGGGNSTYKLQAWYVDTQTTPAQDYGSGATFTPTTGYRIRIVVYSGSTYNAMFYPMIRLATETDATFAPYTNICPISGHTEASVQRDGEQLVPNGTDTSNGYKNGYYLTSNGAENGGADTYISEYFDVVANDSYILKDRIGNANLASVCFYNANKQYISGYAVNRETKIITTPSNAVYARCTQIINLVENEIYFKRANQYTIALGDTIYGGTVRIDSNGNTVMDVDNVKKVVDGTENVSGYGSADGRYGISISGISNANRDNSNISDRLVWHQVSDYTTLGDGEFMIDNIVIVRSSSFPTTGAEDMKTYLAGLYSDGTPLEFVFKLATPFTIQLTTQQIQLLKGQNTLTASTGQISVTANGMSGSIGSVQEQVNATDAALAELAADIAEQLPDAPTTDGAYVLTVTVADGTPTYSWESTT